MKSVLIPCVFSGAALTVTWQFSFTLTNLMPNYLIHVHIRACDFLNLILRSLIVSLSRCEDDKITQGQGADESSNSNSNPPKVNI